MRSIAIENGDIVIRDKRLQTVDGKQQIIQKIAGILSIYKDELFYNADIGIDRNMLFPENKLDDIDDMKRIAVLEALSDIKEIDSIIHFNVKKEKNSVIVKLIIKLKTGEIIDTGGVNIV